MTWGGSYSGMAHYAVTVVELAPVIWASANFTADNLVPELTTTVDFTDQSMGSPALTSWSWTISPNTVTFMEGTSASSRHPKVRFDAAGFYTVTLVAANGNTSDTEVKTNYIHAIDCSDQPFPFTEDFSDGSLPLCWSIVDHNGSGKVWMFSNPLNRSPGTPSAGNGFALFDSQYYGTGQNCDLVSPMLDFTDELGIQFHFHHTYVHLTGTTASVSLSTDGGNSWTVLQSWTASSGTNAAFTQDLSFVAGGQDSVVFKWNFSGTSGIYWAVDDIEITSGIPGLWTGSASSDWNNAANWSDDTVPAASTETTVHPLAGNWPVFNGNLVVGSTCGNLNLPAGSQLTVNGDLEISQGKCLAFVGSGQLNLTGDWTNAGTFVPAQGTVNFTGTAASDIRLTNAISTNASDYTLGTFSVGMTLLSGATTGPVNTDNGYALVPVGFEFNFAGTVNDSVWITTNGCIHMQATGSGNPNNSQLFSTAEPNRVMAPWWDDLTEDGTSNLRYKTEGTAPNRVFTTEWYRFASYRTGATSRLKFQVKLYETTNVIEFHYGTMEGGTHNASESASIGIEDATGGSGRFIDATTGSSTSGNAALVSPGNWPAVNYRFTPGMLNEVFYNAVVSKTGAPVNILSNTEIAGSLTVSPGSALNIPAGIVLQVNGTGN
jgi:PKD repeat protein